MLSRADFELFAWDEEDLKGCDQRVKVIGAPLELSRNLYTDLQNTYKWPQQDENYFELLYILYYDNHCDTHYKLAHFSSHVTHV